MLGDSDCECGTRGVACIVDLMVKMAARQRNSSVKSDKLSLSHFNQHSVLNRRYLLFSSKNVEQQKLPVWGAFEAVCGLDRALS